MITKLLRLVSNKRITSYVVCLNIEGYCGKIKHDGVTYKIPAIKLESNKNNDLINDYIKHNNIGKGEILLSETNLMYIPKLNTIGIGLYIQKKVLLNIAFDLSDQLHLFYLVGLLISKSLLVVNNKDLESTMNINFKDDENEFTNKANELLLIIREKLGHIYVKENPKFKDFDKHQTQQLFKENPNYLPAIFDDLRNSWIYVDN